jgi:hypothetical protein
MQIICCKWFIKFSFPLQLIFCTVRTLNNWSNIYLVFAADRRLISVLSLWPPQTSLSVLPWRALQAAIWLCSTNHPPRTPQTVPFRWTPSSHHGLHRERRYPSFLRVHDNQLSLQCKHQPSTFKRRSSWSSSLCTLSSNPSHQALLMIHSPSTKYSWNALLIIIHSLFTSYGPVLSLEVLNVAWAGSVSSN